VIWCAADPAVQGGEDVNQTMHTKLTPFDNTANDTAGCESNTNMSPPPFTRDMMEQIEVTRSNLQLALQRPDICGMSFMYDQFHDEIVYSKANDNQLYPVTNAMYVRLGVLLEHRGFKLIPIALIREAVMEASDANKIDSAQIWLNQQTWDSTPRVEQFLTTHFGAEDTPYTRAASKYLWSALAGRIITPGVKADMMPIIIGKQGIRKSTAVAAICPIPDAFVEVSLKKTADQARLMRGRLVGEIAQLHSLRTRELEAIKTFVTKTHESWVPKHREHAVTYPRRIVLIGTSNEKEIFSDTTRNRRWIPVEAAKTGQIDVEAIIRDRDQLWAEARVLYERTGIDYRQTEEMFNRHMIRDSWEEAINRWLDEPDLLTGDEPRNRQYLTTHDVLRDAIHIEPKFIQHRDLIRAGKVLRALGYENKKVRDGNRTFWAYKPAVPSQTPTQAAGGGARFSLFRRASRQNRNIPGQHKR